MRERTEPRPSASISDSPKGLETTLRRQGRYLQQLFPAVRGRRGSIFNGPMQEIPHIARLLMKPYPASVVYLWKDSSNDRARIGLTPNPENGVTVLFNVARWLTHHVREVVGKPPVSPGGRHAVIVYSESGGNASIYRMRDCRS